MANICDVTLYARGFKSLDDAKECQELFEKCNEKGEAWTPLFDVVTCFYGEESTNALFLTVSGWTKWSSTRILDSYINRCREESPNIVSVQDICKKYGIYIEILGEESGCNIGEHFGISPAGEMVLEEYFDYSEYYTGDYESYEDFIETEGDICSREEFECTENLAIGEPDTPFGDWIRDIRI